MSYTREPIAETTSAIPSMPPMQLREDREVNPYSHTSRLDKAKASVAETGQTNKGSGAEEPAKTEETVTLSPQMAALARKEQSFRQREQAQKKRDADLDAKLAKVAQLEALKDKITSGDYSDLEELVGYDKFTQWKIDQSSSMTPEQQALKELKSELENVKKSQQDDVSKRFEAAVADRRNAISTLVESNPEFSPLKKGGEEVQKAVLQHILDTWEHDNTELTPEQAAKEVKQVLKERKDKLNLLFADDPVTPQVEEKKQLPPLKQGIKTLTNNMTTQGEVKRPVKSFQGMSDQERYAEARRRAEERLKGK